MKCESCDAEHPGTYGSGRFCGTKCARAFSTSKNRKQISEKISASLALTAQPDVELVCVHCLKSFVAKFTKRSQKYCSKHCSSTATGIRNKEQLSARAKRLHAEGRISSWSSRHKLKPSYPEQYFIDLFKNENIIAQREVKVGRWFIDFVVGNLAIEIDGKQHNYPERAASDRVKDFAVANAGYEIVRVRWYNPRTKLGKELLYPQIEALKMYINQSPCGAAW